MYRNKKFTLLRYNTARSLQHLPNRIKISIEFSPKNEFNVSLYQYSAIPICQMEERLAFPHSKFILGLGYARIRSTPGLIKIRETAAED